MFDEVNEFPIAPCPWCKKPPSLHTPYYSHESSGTFRWTVGCCNHACLVNPEGRKINIRKKQRFDPDEQLRKMYYIVDDRNKENPFAPSHKIIITRSAVIEAIECYTKETSRRT